jgi:hypothetical protein
MRSTPLRTIGLAAAGVAIQLFSLPVLPAAASGGGGGHGIVHAVSGPTPFTGGCPGRRLDAEAIPGSEVEPAIAVDPSDPRTLVTTWQQDVGGASSRSDLVASSRDGGRSWHTAAIPRLTACTGGQADFASDPWLSIGADGTVYFSGTTGTATSQPPPVAVVASTSGDHGKTWRAPTTIAPAEPGNDSDSVTASPTRAGRAYLVWANWDHTYQLPMTGALRFSRTTDHGSHWSAPVLVHQPSATSIDFSGHIVVLRDGTLLTVWANFDLAQGVGTLMASRSRDEGRTWQSAVDIASQPVGMFADPETGQELPQPGFPSVALSPDGTVYVASESSSSPNSGAVSVARSRDGGRTWSTSRLPGVTAFAFEPAIAVDSRGRVGLLWYDLRRDVPGDAALTTDVWFARSSDRGATWRQSHVAGPFDLRTAPIHWIGEYQGLVGSRSGFAGVVTMAAPRAKNGPSDVFLVRPGA